MSALVTGAGGFLGATLVERLLARGGERLRLFVRPGGKQQELEALARRFGAEVEFVVGSLTNPADCARAVDGADTVYHLAAGTRGPAAERFLHSVVASKHLLDAIVAERPRAKLVLVSSFSVYGVAALGRGALVDERTPVESHPERRDVHAQSKLRQERLFWEYRERHGVPLVVLRPGVIYGPGGTAISGRVGLDLFGVFLHLGGNNQLPLNYVANCAEAIVVAGRHPDAVGQIYNTVDDDLPTCAEYLRAYRNNVEPLRTVRMPYLATVAMSVAVQKYHGWSKGQLPAVFTPYKTAALWGGNRFSNEKIKNIGYRELVSTREGMRRTFETFKKAKAA
jgi:nucleoside-diphosphate-sugar epimerase